MTTLPTADQVRSVPAVLDHVVGEDLVDENGHFNITGYFRDGTWALWTLVQGLGVDADYLEHREMSFFTTEQHIRYLREMRLGDRYTVHPVLVGRAHKALHTITFVVDAQRDAVACTLEIMYVHVSMTKRHSVPIPDDIAERLDASIAEHPWAAAAATGLTLRR